MPEPLFNDQYLLQRMPGKGGWTYLVLPAVPKEYRGWFNAVKVNGCIDNYELKNSNLMSMKTGGLFMPVKAEIRKKIGKEAGDYVQLKLYAEREPATGVREEFMACLEDEPIAHKAFSNCTATEQQEFIEWIAAAKSEEAKVGRIVKTIDQLNRDS